VAALLVTFPAELLTVTVYCEPASELTVAGVVYDAEVAPLMAVPLRNHWNVKGVLPVATTAKLAVCPEVTD
jgi:hypothetical protein